MLARPEDAPDAVSPTDDAATQLVEGAPAAHLRPVAAPAAHEKASRHVVPAARVAPAVAALPNTGGVWSGLPGLGFVAIGAGLVLVRRRPTA
jgi:LPXTG-motif cell wall-anchored protein